MIIGICAGTRHGDAFRLQGPAAKWMCRAYAPESARDMFSGVHVLDGLAVATDGTRAHICTADLDDGLYVPVDRKARRWLAPAETALPSTVTKVVAMVREVVGHPAVRAVEGNDWRNVPFAPVVSELSGILGFGLDHRLVRDALGLDLDPYDGGGVRIYSLSWEKPMVFVPNGTKNDMALAAIVMPLKVGAVWKRKDEGQLEVIHEPPKGCWDDIGWREVGHGTPEGPGNGDISETPLTEPPKE